MQQDSIELSRILLTELRQIMGSNGSDEERLQHLVEQIAKNIDVDVCSVYVVRAGEVLELFATAGLRSEAIHQTRLRVGEGLVGLVAATKNPQKIDDVAMHPDFVFKPETGEGQLQGFLGVPILRQDCILGVLDIQNKDQRVFSDDVVEMLQNIAMLLAEFLVATGISNRDEIFSDQNTSSNSVILKGVCINKGVAVGQAIVLRSKLTISNILSENPWQEHQKLSTALKKMHLEIDDMLSDKVGSRSGEHKDILETYALIAKDSGWIKQMHEAIDEGLSAVAAVRKVTNLVKSRLSDAQDHYLRERAMDFEDLGSRVLRHLDPKAYGEDLGSEIDEVILFARTMGPARLLDFDHKKLKALILAEASKNSHVAIIAKALNIPVLGLSLDNFHKVEDGDDICLDAMRGSLILRADDNIKDQYRQTIIAYAKQASNIQTLQQKPAVTKDGEHISLRINAGLRSDMDHFKHIRAGGVGLFRTEIPFMVRSQPPTVEWQRQIYADILAMAEGKPVVFRTLDIGGDKILPWRAALDEENPAMGWRAVRVSTDVPALLRHQLRALVQAAEGVELRVLFPMVTEMREWHFCKEILMQEVSRHSQKTGKKPSPVRVGIMFEVPALMLQIDEILSHVDFVSIGSNDLVQFLFASDRSSRLVSERFDAISPIMLNFYRDFLRQAEKKNVPVTLCGEMASDPLGALALIAVGFKRLSMVPLAIPSIRDMICSVNIKQLSSWMDVMLNMKSQAPLRKRLKQWAIDQNIDLT